MGIELFRARSHDDREALFRFRYSIYVEEMGRYRGIADHEGRRLVEPEDAHSILYGARDDQEIVGTSRMTLGADGISERQVGQYGLTMPSKMFARSSTRTRRTVPARLPAALTPSGLAFR